METTTVVIIIILAILFLARGAFRAKNAKLAKLGAQRGIIIRTYRGYQATATKLFEADAIEMAAKDFFPKSQTWMKTAIIKPYGALTVTYERRTVGDEKTCPQCAEQVKAAALVCRFCGYKFPESGNKDPTLAS